MGTCHAELACCGAENEIQTHQLSHRDMSATPRPHDMSGQFLSMGNMTESQRVHFLATSGHMGSSQQSLIRHIVQIQSSARGWLVRQRMKKIKTLLREASEKGEFVDNLDENCFFVNPRVKYVYDRYGPFQIPDLKISSDVQIEDKGFYRLHTGFIYKGQWQIDLNTRCGKGTQVWLDGSFYEGQWQNGQCNGIGRLIHADGDIYEGEWRDDKANGQGKYLHYDGQVYDGQWRNDKQHGWGVEKWTDGAKYEGEYQNGKKSGHGFFCWGDGAQYVGQFNNNDIEGRGKYTWVDGRSYDGDWRGNAMHGRGLFKYRDGRYYEGQFVNDKKEGQGLMVWPDGRRYEGSWSQGKQHGPGVHTDANGNVQNGEWSVGKLIYKFDDDGNKISATSSAMPNRASAILQSDQTVAKSTLIQNY